MLSDLRRAQILADAREQGGVSLRELSDRFDVSIPTIRRDLCALADQGLVRRVHGGAVALRADRGAARRATAILAYPPARSVPGSGSGSGSGSGAGGGAGPGAGVRGGSGIGVGTDATGTEVPGTEAAGAAVLGGAVLGAAPGGVASAGVASGGVASGGVAPGDVAPGGAALSGVALSGVALSGVAQGGVATGAAGAGGVPADRDIYVARRVTTVAEAAAMVTAGMAIGISGGVAAICLAGLLDDVPGLTVVTPVPAVAAAVVNRATVVVLVGGVRTPSGSHAGPLTEATLAQLNLDLAFVEPHDAATTGDALAAQTDQALVRRATTAVFLEIAAPGPSSR